MTESDHHCLLTGPEAQDDDSSDSDIEDQSSSQDTAPKESQAQPSNVVRRTRASSARAGLAAWSGDSGSDDSRRWSDQLSLDEKDGFIVVNYSEGHLKQFPQAQSSAQPSQQEVRHYNKLKTGKKCSSLITANFLQQTLFEKQCGIMLQIIFSALPIKYIG